MTANMEVYLLLAGSSCVLVLRVFLFLITLVLTCTCVEKLMSVHKDFLLFQTCN